MFFAEPMFPPMLGCVEWQELCNEDLATCWDNGLDSSDSPAKLFEEAFPYGVQEHATTDKHLAFILI